ncbi:MAG: DNA alkylation repair protein [Clostridiales bacterium]|nr:DNA alkylation repair protein [Clostridiales bacterium]
MSTEEIRQMLFDKQDKAYRDFQVKLIPGMDVDSMIGVRTPDLRKMAKELAKCPDISAFLEELPHKYFDENQLHAFIISEIRDYDLCMERVCAFLPYVDNWATCDQMSPKAFGKGKAFEARCDEFLEQIRAWMASGETYTVRFGIGMLMSHFLDARFEPKFLAMVAKVRSEEYYVNMMIAWYFATALAKQYEAAVVFLEKKKLAPWVHNKSIQKAVESYRVTPERKEYLRSLKVAVKK